MTIGFPAKETAPMPNSQYLHPDCPDWRLLGPTATDAAIRAHSDIVVEQQKAKQQVWAGGFTRRRMLQGGAMAGVAAFGSQLVTTQVSYAAPGSVDTGALIVVFLRGGMDGLSVLVPARDEALIAARPAIKVGEAGLLQIGGPGPAERTFGLHPALAALKPMLDAGKIAAVPAISTPDLTASHFQAQDCLERGGSSGSPLQTGWLSRALERSGPGTTWRGLGTGYQLDRSLTGPTNSIAVPELKDFKIRVDDSMLDATRTALGNLYTGLDHPVATQTNLALTASGEAQALAAAEASSISRGFPDNGFARDLATLSTLIRGDVGVRVGTVDLGGWDMHTQLGTPDKGDMKNMLTELGGALAAFLKDLGAKAETTTVVVMSEFGRRIDENEGGGVDHGHGGLALVMGGGVKGGVHGSWKGLDKAVQDYGNVPGTNDFRDLLGEVVMKRLNLTTTDAGFIFPDWTVSQLGVMV